MLDDDAVRFLEAAAGSTAIRNATGASLLSIGCGGSPTLLFDVDDTEKLTGLLAAASELAVECRVLGRGTNLLIADSGFEGVLFRLAGSFKNCRVDEDTIFCGGGVSLPRVAAVALENALSGLEPLARIPGSIGGGVAMNAGSYGTSIGELLEEVQICSAASSCITLSADALHFGYRSVDLDDAHIVALAVLRLKKADAQTIKESMKSFASLRKKSQPLASKTFGSVFKNPQGDLSAGALLEGAGCKSKISGGAIVSDLHANFIVNRGNATTTDVINLMNICRRLVYQNYGLALEPEVRFLGDIGLDPL